MRTILAVLAAALWPWPAAPEAVELLVTVKDARGRLVEGLAIEDFRVLEDRVEQKVMSFSADAAPLSVAVLLDAALNRPSTARLRATFASLVQAFSDADEAGVFVFQDSLRTAVDFTSDKERLRAGLRQIELGADYTQAGEPLSLPAPRINNWPIGGPPAGGPRASLSRPVKHLDDAVAEGLRRLEARDPARRRIILLISDGINSPGNRVSAEELTAALRKGNVAVYSIGLDAARLPRGSSALARYGPPSGGELFKAAKPAALEALYARITEQARYRYRLVYAPGRPPSVAPVVRRIQVQVKRKDVTVIAPDGRLPEARSPGSGGS